MSLELIASEFFLEQVKGLSEKSKRQVKKKIALIKQNPFRFKKIHSKRFSRAFRIRLSIDSKETRLIYVILGSKIVLACLLDRANDYKDLENYLSKVK